jgi:hypothetical protein
VRRHCGKPAARRRPSCEGMRTATNMAMNLLSLHKPTHTSTPSSQQKVPNERGGL